MWVCLCKGITDRQIRAAVDRGARTSRDVGRMCGAGTRCGGCLPEVQRLVCDYLSAETCFDCPELELIEIPERLEETVTV